VIDALLGHNRSLNERQNKIGLLLNHHNKGGIIVYAFKPPFFMQKLRFLFEMIDHTTEGSKRLSEAYY